MSVIRIQGLQRLHGEISIQGSKNAALPVMAAALLHSGVVVIKNVPGIQDVFCMMEILEGLGCRCCRDGHTLTIDTRGLCCWQVPEDEGRRMRSSVMLLGPLLGRLHRVNTCYPGGCSIGRRPIDLHLSALEQMGAKICGDEERVEAFAEKLCGTDIRLCFPSVGATENILMAAVAAEGITQIYGAAREPEIQVLCRFLETLGARIDGIGSGFLQVHGGRTLHDGEFTVPGDRIVAGTYLGAVMAAGGEVCLLDAPTDHMAETLCAAQQAGCMIEQKENRLFAKMNGRPLAVNLATGPYPEFSTDLQSVMLAVSCVAQGESWIQENVFEERFATAGELTRLGADIRIEDGTAFVRGKYPLRGNCVQAFDLRGGAALVVAALAAEGESQVHDCFYICRGYEDICRDLTAAGARLSFEGNERKYEENTA